MMNGYIIKRGKEYMARRKKYVRKDSDGFCWTEDIQKARVFTDYGLVCRKAVLAGGTVHVMRALKAEE